MMGSLSAPVGGRAIWGLVLGFIWGFLFLIEIIQFLGKSIPCRVIISQIIGGKNYGKILELKPATLIMNAYGRGKV